MPTYTEMPALDKWKIDSRAAATAKSFGDLERDKDIILKRLDALIEGYHSTSDGCAQAYMTTDLFFTIDYWLKLASQKNSGVNSSREPAVMALYKFVIDSLCALFGGVTVNVLPRELEMTFGRELGYHGGHIDAMPGVATYLTRAEARKYKLFFKEGRAYQYQWNSRRWKDKKLQLANSKQVGWKYHSSIKSNMFDDGYAGFCCSMSRDLYMAHHKGGFDRDNFFHSSYLGGDTVMCTGSMKIINGEITGIKNDSGHYRPTLDHIVNVLETLQMFGVDLKVIKVSWFDKSKNKYSWNMGDVVLAARGNYDRLRAGQVEFADHWDKRRQKKN